MFDSLVCRVTVKLFDEILVCIRYELLNWFFYAQIEEGAEPGKLRVTAKTTEGEEIVDEYNTVVLAVGRDPCTSDIGLEKAGVELAK